jgi:hypothetical protein
MVTLGVSNYMHVTRLLNDRTHLDVYGMCDLLGEVISLSLQVNLREAIYIT